MNNKDYCIRCVFYDSVLNENAPFTRRGVFGSYLDGRSVEIIDLTLIIAFQGKARNLFLLECYVISC